MSDMALIGMILLATAVGAVAGYIIGREHGIDYGRASQFVDDFIERGHRERARHGKDGKYISTRRATP